MHTFPFTTTLNDRTVSSAQLDALTPETFRAALDAIKERRYHETPHSETQRAWNYRDTPYGRLQLNAQRDAIICGFCNFPAANHADVTTRWRKGRFIVHEDSDGFKQYCNRYADEISNPEVDYVRTRNIDLPLQENVQPEYVTDTNDQYAYSPADVEMEKLDRYHDRLPTEHTVTLDEYRNGKRTNLDLEPEQRNAYIEGNDGFVSIKVLDELLTRKYHARLLNLFVNKQGKRQIGSVVIQNTDGTRTAKCVKCKGTLNFPDSPTRAQMEEFVYAIISHGNNHVAKWFREREEAGVALYYSLAPTLGPQTTELNAREVIVQHYRNCKTPGCNCTELLMEISTKQNYVKVGSL